MKSIKYILTIVLMIGALGFGFILWADYKVNQVTQHITEQADAYIAAPARGAEAFATPIVEATSELVEYAASGEMEKDYGESAFHENFMEANEQFKDFLDSLFGE